MMNNLSWEPLETRQIKASLCTFYKMFNHLANSYPIQSLHLDLDFLLPYGRYNTGGATAQPQIIQNIHTKLYDYLII